MSYTPTKRGLYDPATGRGLYDPSPSSLRGLYDSCKEVSLSIYAAGIGMTTVYNTDSPPSIETMYNDTKTTLEAETWPTPVTTTIPVYAGNSLSYVYVDGEGVDQYEYGLGVSYGYINTTAYSGETLVSIDLTMGVGIGTTDEVIKIGFFASSTNLMPDTVALIMGPTIQKDAVDEFNTYAVSTTLDDYLIFTMWGYPIYKPDLPTPGTNFNESNLGRFDPMPQSAKIRIT